MSRHSKVKHRRVLWHPRCDWLMVAVTQGFHDDADLPPRGSLFSRDGLSRPALMRGASAPVPGSGGGDASASRSLGARVRSSKHLPFDSPERPARREDAARPDTPPLSAALPRELAERLTPLDQFRHHVRHPGRDPGKWSSPESEARAHAASETLRQWEDKRAKALAREHERLEAAEAASAERMVRVARRREALLRARAEAGAREVSKARARAAQAKRKADRRTGGGGARATSPGARIANAVGRVFGGSPLFVPSTTPLLSPSSGRVADDEFSLGPSAAAATATASDPPGPRPVTTAVSRHQAAKRIEGELAGPGIRRAASRVMEVLGESQTPFGTFEESAAAIQSRDLVAATQAILKRAVKCYSHALHGLLTMLHDDEDDEEDEVSAPRQSDPSLRPLVSQSGRALLAAVLISRFPEDILTGFTPETPSTASVVEGDEGADAAPLSKAQRMVRRATTVLDALRQLCLWLLDSGEAPVLRRSPSTRAVNALLLATNLTEEDVAALPPKRVAAVQRILAFTAAWVEYMDAFSAWKLGDGNRLAQELVLPYRTMLSKHHKYSERLREAQAKYRETGLPGEVPAMSQLVEGTLSHIQETRQQVARLLGVEGAKRWEKEQHLAVGVSVGEDEEASDSDSTAAARPVAQAPPSPLLSPTEASSSPSRHAQSMPRSRVMREVFSNELLAHALMVDPTSRLPLPPTDETVWVPPAASASTPSLMLAALLRKCEAGEWEEDEEGEGSAAFRFRSAALAHAAGASLAPPPQATVKYWAERFSEAFHGRLETLPDSTWIASAVSMAGSTMAPELREFAIAVSSGGNQERVNSVLGDSVREAHDCLIALLPVRAEALRKEIAEELDHEQFHRSIRAGAINTLDWLAVLSKSISVLSSLEAPARAGVSSRWLARCKETLEALAQLGNDSRKAFEASGMDPREAAEAVRFHRDCLIALALAPRWVAFLHSRVALTRLDAANFHLSALAPHLVRAGVGFQYEATKFRERLSRGTVTPVGTRQWLQQSVFGSLARGEPMAAPEASEDPAVGKVVGPGGELRRLLPAQEGAFREGHPQLRLAAVRDGLLMLLRYDQPLSRVAVEAASTGIGAVVVVKLARKGEEVKALPVVLPFPETLQMDAARLQAIQDALQRLAIVATLTLFIGNASRSPASTTTGWDPHSSSLVASTVTSLETVPSFLNVLLGEPDVSLEGIVAACKRAALSIAWASRAASPPSSAALEKLSTLVGDAVRTNHPLYTLMQKRIFDWLRHAVTAQAAALAKSVGLEEPVESESPAHEEWHPFLAPPSPVLASTALPGASLAEAEGIAESLARLALHTEAVHGEFYQQLLASLLDPE
jgi:hypothetical protein